MSPVTHKVLPYIVVHDEDENFESTIQGDIMDWMDSYSLKHKGNNRSNVNGYQSPDNFYTEPSFDKFLSYIEDRVDKMIETYREHEYVSWDNQYKLLRIELNYFTILRILAVQIT